MRRLPWAALSAVLVSSWLVVADPAEAAEPPGGDRVEYRPPVDAEVVDGFRPPATDWSPGNRGLDYATADGDPVAAAAGGEVVFAGSVGGSRHVVVLHADGVRTSYSFLRSTTLRRGDRVDAGATVGEAGGRLHFGARIGEAYVDPALLLADRAVEVHLVPNADPRPLSEAGERGGLARMLDRTVSALLRAGAPAFTELEGLVQWASGVYPLRFSAEGMEALGRWWDQRDDCTPESTPPPPPGSGERRIMVQVAGLGSSGGPAGAANGAVFDIDTAALGYRPDDVVRFSYRGGSVEESAYEADDTTVDIRDSARHLDRLLAEIAARNPGIPIDVVAHSQGGLVARWALTEEADGADPRRAPVRTLVTLGTPHHGADAATAAAMVAGTGAGRLVSGAGEALLGFDLDGPAVAQLAERSDFIERLNRRPLPEGVAVTSIAVRSDLVVPAARSRLDGARNVVVSVPADGLGHLQAHDRLPASDPARREIALALAGLPPTCQGFLDAMTDTLVPEGISIVEDQVGLAAWAGARAVDAATLGSGR